VAKCERYRFLWGYPIAMIGIKNLTRKRKKILNLEREIKFEFL